MRPDLDDYEELNDEGAPRSRAMSWLVLVVAVGGFAALAYYAYHSGTQSIKDGQVMVVQADQTPIKGQPTDAGGEQFPDKDKTIYDAIGQDEGNTPEEKLLPEAEQPVIPRAAITPDVAKPAEPASANTYVNKSVAGVEAPVDPVDAQSMKQGGPETAPLAKPALAPEAVANSEDEEDDIAPIADAKPSTSAPEFVNVKPAKAAPAQAAAPAAKPVEKPTAKPSPKAEAKPVAKSAAATGSYQVQLGAFKSEDEARQQWSKIVAKSGGVINGAPIIVKADLANGTFYRLRASGFASPDAAKAACTKLSAKGQACFYAGK